MKQARLRFGVGARHASPLHAIALSHVARLRLRLPLADAGISVDVIDAGVRGLAVVTVLILSLLGYGKPGDADSGFSLDPVYVAFALVAYNLLVVGLLGVPWRTRPGFGLFVLDWFVVSAALVLTGGFFSPFVILYYALVIGAALRLGLPRSLTLVGGCGLAYAALALTHSQPGEAIQLPVFAVAMTSLLMVAVTALAMKHTVEVEVRKVELEEQSASQLRLLNDLTRVVLSGSPNLEEVMRTVAAVSSRALNADSGLAVLFAPKPGDLHDQDVQESVVGPLIASDRTPSSIELSQGEASMADAAARAQAPVVLEDASADREHARQSFPGLLRDGRPVRSVACVPLMLGGSVIGVLFVGRQALKPFNEADLTLLTAIGQQMAVAVRLARLYEMERDRASRSEERERLERDLLSMVSHELRTPLTAIKTCVGALNSLEDASRGSTGEEAMEARLLHNIGRSTDRLITLVNELLDMARLRAGRVSLNRQKLNLGEVVQEIAGQVKPLLDAKQQTLTVDVPALGSHRWHLLSVSADRRRVEQVMLNLLGNANKYTPPGGNIALGATPRDGQVKVFVRDDGPGIAPGEEERIFEKYYRLANDGQNEARPDSSGLGLAIARSIVALHGGRIGVHSRLGRGSTFYFVLPAEPAYDLQTAPTQRLDEVNS